MSQQLTWFVIRASGLVAWGLVTASIVWGLLLAARRARRPRPAWTNDLHRFLGALSCAFVGLHVTALLLDDYVQFSIADVIVPMRSQWRPGAVTWGIVAFDVLLVVQITSMLMTRLPRRLWHSVHLFGFVVFGASTTHAFTAGADARNPWTYAFAVGSTATITVLVVYRVGVRRFDSRRRAVRTALRRYWAAHPPPEQGETTRARSLTAIAEVVDGIAPARDVARSRGDREPAAPRAG